LTDLAYRCQNVLRWRMPTSISDLTAAYRRPRMAHQASRETGRAGVVFWLFGRSFLSPRLLYFPRDFCIFPVNYRQIVKNYCCFKWFFTISQRSVRLGVVCGPREQQWERINGKERRPTTKICALPNKPKHGEGSPNCEFHHRTLSVALLTPRSRLLANARVTAHRRVLQAAYNCRSVIARIRLPFANPPTPPPPVGAPALLFFTYRTRLANTFRVDLLLFRRIYPRRVNCCRQSTFT
jgi:hypothetical protein